MIDPWASVRDFSTASFKSHWDGMIPMGFRALTLSVYGPAHAPSYAAVFVRREPPFPEVNLIQGVNASLLIDLLQTYKTAGFSPTLVSATGAAHEAVFACVVERNGRNAMPLVSLRNDPANDATTLKFWLDYADANDRIPRSFCTYGLPDAVRYALILEDNTERLLWTVAGPEPLEQYLERCEAHRQQYARPVMVSVGPAGYASLFREDDVGPWQAHVGADSAGYQFLLDTLRDRDGLVPVAVQAGYNSGLNRFAAVFAGSNRPATRRLTVNGTPVPALAAIDDRITRYLRDTGTRAASVAITRRDRLVYSRAFTWAEPAYPVTTPASTFRIASLSKPITALATMRLVEEGLLGLDDTRIPRLGLVEPNGRPVSEATRRITVRQLLAHTSGLGGIPSAHQVAAAFGVSVPVNERQVAAFGLADVAFEPGRNKQYSNLGYLVLGLIIEAVTGEPYEAAVNRLVHAPLRLTRPHLTSPRRSEQRPGAVRHHSGGRSRADLPFEPSEIAVRTFRLPDGTVIPLGSPDAPHPYGAEDFGFFDAFGGWSMAAADYARILAAFDRAPHPILNAASVTQMTTAVSVGPPSNYGLGWIVNVGGGETMVGHNGLLAGAWPIAMRSSLGWSFVLLQNSDASPWWELSDELAAMLRALTAWPAEDRWPEVGIGSW